MKVSFQLHGRRYTVTTEHSASSYGVPVLLIDGELSDVEVIRDGVNWPCDFDEAEEA